MKKKISFIAVGQAGGNIGQLFEEKGFPVLYVNTSQEDLDTLENSSIISPAVRAATKTDTRQNSSLLTTSTT